MAYSIQMKQNCDAPGCLSRPTYRVHAYRNEIHGHYCKKHADQRVKALTAAEANNPAGFR